LVARCEPYRPRYRAGIATLPALAGWRVRRRARTLGTALDNGGEFLSGSGAGVNVELSSDDNAESVHPSGLDRTSGTSLFIPSLVATVPVDENRRFVLTANLPLDRLQSPPFIPRRTPAMSRGCYAEIL